MTVRTTQVRAGAHTRPGGGVPVASRTRRQHLVLALLCSLPWAGQSDVLPDSDYAALAKAVIDQVVVPAHVEHARAMRRLGPAIERHCMGDSAVDVAAVDVAAVRAAFGEAMDAWQRVWPFGLGPVMRGAGRARIAFWPGRPGSAARQMRKALRTRDESLLDPGQLAGKSVAVKDLHALERLLFDVPRNAYTCGLAGAIARYQSNLAEEIVHEVDEGGRLPAGRDRCRSRQRRVRRRCGGRPRHDARPLRESGRHHCAEAGGAARRERGEGETQACGELAKRNVRCATSSRTSRRSAHSSRRLAVSRIS